MKNEQPVRRRVAGNCFPLFPQEPRYRVISLSKNLDLLWAREAVLRTAGFQVFSTLSQRQALAKVQGGDFGVLLLCYSLPRQLLLTIANEFRKHCPNGRVVAIVDSHASHPPEIDAVVSNADGQDALIDALLGNATSKAA